MESNTTKLNLYILRGEGHPFLVGRRTEKNDKGRHVTREEFLKLGCLWPTRIAQDRQALATLIGETILDEVFAPTAGSQVSTGPSPDKTDPRIFTALMNGLEAGALRKTAEHLASTGFQIVCLASNSPISLVVAVSEELSERFPAGRLVEKLAPFIGGRGGGTPKIAQAGGNIPAFDQVFSYLKELIPKSDWII